MRKYAKHATIAVMALLLLTTATAMAAGSDAQYVTRPSSGWRTNDAAVGVNDNQEISAPSAEVAEPDKTAAYASFTGRVAEIIPYYVDDKPVEGKCFVLVEDADGGLMNFVVDNETVSVTGSTLSVGSSFTGFYEANRPMILIYPPQAHADVAVVDLPDGMSVKADLFDANLISRDGELKLNVGKDTVIVAEDGSTVSADTIGNRRLVVVYGASTRSIPAQTAPETIVVLNENTGD